MYVYIYTYGVTQQCAVWSHSLAFWLETCSIESSALTPSVVRELRENGGRFLLNYTTTALEHYVEKHTETMYSVVVRKEQLIISLGMTTLL